MSAQVTRDGTEVTVTLPSGAVIIVDAGRRGSPWLGVPPGVSWSDAAASADQILAALRADAKAEAEAACVLVHAALEAARAES